MQARTHTHTHAHLSPQSYITSPSPISYFRLYFLCAIYRSIASFIKILSAPSQPAEHHSGCSVEGKWKGSKNGGGREIHEEDDMLQHSTTCCWHTTEKVGVLSFLSGSPNQKEPDTPCVIALWGGLTLGEREIQKHSGYQGEHYKK